MNVALYGSQKRWCLTETSRLIQAEESLTIGDSRMQRLGQKLTITLNERNAVGGRTLQGTVEIDLGKNVDHARTFELTGDGSHRWTPFAPRAACTVTLQDPNVNFAGTAYVDGNAGDAPLEQGFSQWSWSRAASDDDDLAWICYETDSKAGARAIHLAQHGAQLEEIALTAPKVRLGRGLYGMTSWARLDAVHEVTALEDTPFYTRNLVQGTLGERRVTMVHEQLDLERFCKPWVQFLLPFRMRHEG